MPWEKAQSWAGSPRPASSQSLMATMRPSRKISSLRPLFPLNRLIRGEGSAGMIRLEPVDDLGDAGEGRGAALEPVLLPDPEVVGHGHGGRLGHGQELVEAVRLPIERVHEGELLRVLEGGRAAEGVALGAGPVEAGDGGAALHEYAHEVRTALGEVDALVVPEGFGDGHGRAPEAPVDLPLDLEGDGHDAAGGRVDAHGEVAALTGSALAHIRSHHPGLSGHAREDLVKRLDLDGRAQALGEIGGDSVLRDQG